MAGGGWQPIETAPRDGRWVLVFGNILTGYMPKVARYEHTEDGPKWVVWACRSDACGVTHVGYMASASHWMPLPAAPELK